MVDFGSGKFNLDPFNIRDLSYMERIRTAISDTLKWSRWKYFIDYQVETVYDEAFNATLPIIWQPGMRLDLRDIRFVDSYNKQLPHSFSTATVEDVYGTMGQVTSGGSTDVSISNDIEVHQTLVRWKGVSHYNNSQQTSVNITFPSCNPCYGWTAWRSNVFTVPSATEALFLPGKFIISVKNNQPNGYTNPLNFTIQLRNYPSNTTKAATSITGIDRGQSATAEFDLVYADTNKQYRVYVYTNSIDSFQYLGNNTSISKAYFYQYVETKTVNPACTCNGKTYTYTGTLNSGYLTDWYIVPDGFFDNGNNHITYNISGSGLADFQYFYVSEGFIESATSNVTNHGTSNIVIPDVNEATVYVRWKGVTTSLQKSGSNTVTTPTETSGYDGQTELNTDPLVIPTLSEGQTFSSGTFSTSFYNTYDVSRYFGGRRLREDLVVIGECAGAWQNPKTWRTCSWSITAGQLGDTNYGQVFCNQYRTRIVYASATVNYTYYEYNKTLNPYIAIGGATIGYTGELDDGGWSEWVEVPAGMLQTGNNIVTHHIASATNAAAVFQYRYSTEGSGGISNIVVDLPADTKRVRMYYGNGQAVSDITGSGTSDYSSSLIQSDKGINQMCPLIVFTDETHWITQELDGTYKIFITSEIEGYCYFNRTDVELDGSYKMFISDELDSLYKIDVDTELESQYRIFVSQEAEGKYVINVDSEIDGEYRIFASKDITGLYTIELPVEITGKYKIDRVISLSTNLILLDRYEDESLTLSLIIRIITYIHHRMRRIKS